VAIYVLVVDEDSMFAQRLAQRFQPGVDIVDATNRLDALALIDARDDLAGVIADVHLGPDDPRGGAIVLAHAAERLGDVPLVAFTRYEADPDVRAVVTAVGALCVSKGAGEGALEAHVARMVRWASVRPWRASGELPAQKSVPPPALDDAAELLRAEVFADAKKRGLDERHAAALFALLRGLDRTAAAEELGISPSAYDKRMNVVRDVYDKTTPQLHTYFSLLTTARARGAR
jgi:DNA-binding NarL/FixJ family response regulator